MKLVLRLSRAGKVGALLVLVGVAIGVYGRAGDEPVPWAIRTSVALVVTGAILYYTSRYRSFKRKRKL